MGSLRARSGRRRRQQQQPIGESAVHPYTQGHGEVGEAKFIHVWQNKDGVWKITHVISYDQANK